MAPTYKLIYFNAKGRAETIRYIFAAAGVQYEDSRVEFGKWTELKPNTPWGTLPFLDVDGEQIGESMVICRYLAKETGLGGTSAIETALMDSVAATMQDIFEKYIAAKFAKGDDKTKEELMKAYKEETVPKILEKLENFLMKSKCGDDYFVGNKLSWADLHFVAMGDLLHQHVPTVLEGYPKLNALQKRVAALPKVAEWIKSRPQTDI